MKQIVSLDKIPEGRSCRVRELCMTGVLRERLQEVGMIPGTEVTCLLKGPDPVAYRVRGAVIALRGMDAGGVLVEM